MVAFIELPVELQEQIWAAAFWWPAAHFVELCGTAGIPTSNPSLRTRDPPWTSLQVFPAGKTEDTWPSSKGQLSSQRAASANFGWLRILHVCRLSRAAGLKKMALAGRLEECSTFDKPTLGCKYTHVRIPSYAGAGRQGTAASKLVYHHMWQFPFPDEVEDLCIFNLHSSPKHEGITPALGGGLNPALTLLPWEDWLRPARPGSFSNIAMIFHPGWQQQRSTPGAKARAVPQNLTKTVACRWCWGMNGGFTSAGYDFSVPWASYSRDASLGPCMYECCLSNWLLQAFHGMENFYFVVGGIPRPTAAEASDLGRRICFSGLPRQKSQDELARPGEAVGNEDSVGWQYLEPLDVYDGNDRVFYEVVRGDGYDDLLTRPTQLLQYLQQMFVKAETNRCLARITDDRPPADWKSQVKFKILSWTLYADYWPSSSEAAA